MTRFSQKNSYSIPYKKNFYSQEIIEVLEKYMKKSENLHYLKYEECELFEKEFAKYYGRKYAISNTSGTASLHIALLACDIGEGDEVILTPHVAYAVGNAILYVRAKPVFVDIDKDTLTIDVSKIEEKITSKTKAIIAIHTYGHPADMDPIMSLAKRYNLFVIEDTTHALGSKYKGRKLPMGGDKNIGIYSFNMKQLWLPPSGGMVVTDREDIAKKAMLLRDSHHGDLVGYPYRMHSMTALVGRIQFRQLEEYVEMQRICAKNLNDLLASTPVALPTEKDWAYHAYARYAILAPKRNALVEFLGKQGIDCKILYATPTHLLKLYSEKFEYKEGDFSVTEIEKKQELSLPEPRFRSKGELEYIANKIIEFYSKNK